MTFLLEPDTYVRVRPLFEDMTYHLAVLTVLTGTVPGRIYVDDLASPETAIVVPSNRHRMYVSGLPKRDMLEDVIRLLSKEFRVENYGFVVYYDGTHLWKQTLEHMLQTQESFFGWRQFYHLKEFPSSRSKPLPENIIIGRIDETLIENTSLENRQLLLEEILSESPSLEHFFRQNFGFYARDDHKLIAWCLAEYHYQGHYELGIETIEAYQRQGVAVNLALAVIRHAFTRGATEIGWHCWDTNTPSIATALRLGFEKVLDYPVCYLYYTTASTQ